MSEKPVSLRRSASTPLHGHGMRKSPKSGNCVRPKAPEWRCPGTGNKGETAPLSLQKRSSRPVKKKPNSNSCMNWICLLKTDRTHCQGSVRCRWCGLFCGRGKSLARTRQILNWPDWACMVKTHLSLSDNPRSKGCPKDGVWPFVKSSPMAVPALLCRWPAPSA